MLEHHLHSERLDLGDGTLVITPYLAAARRAPASRSLLRRVPLVLAALCQDLVTVGVRG